MGSDTSIDMRWTCCVNGRRIVSVIARGVAVDQTCGASGMRRVSIDDIEAWVERTMHKALKTPTRV